MYTIKARSWVDVNVRWILKSGTLQTKDLHGIWYNEPRFESEIYFKKNCFARKKTM